MFRRRLGPVLLMLAMVLAFRAPLPYFIEQPGSLFGLSELVRVQGYDDPLRGELLFGTVNVRTATLAGALRTALDAHAELVRRERLIPQGLDSEAFFAQQRAEFELAADVAAAVGLRGAGLPVDPETLRGEGALVLRVARGGPAQGLLRPGDVITQVNGRGITTQLEFTAAVGASGWDPLRFTVLRDGEADEVRLAPSATEAGRPSVGLVVSTFRPQVSLPLEVHVDSARVGGPSAGLAIALTVFDLAAPEDLLGGRNVVVTGTVDPDGRVGRIGGVRFKAVAARRAGADLLLVPASQLSEARAAVGEAGRPRLVGVESFEEALAALRAQTSRRSALPGGPRGRVAVAHRAA